MEKKKVLITEGQHKGLVGHVEIDWGGPVTIRVQGGILRSFNRNQFVEVR